MIKGVFLSALACTVLVTPIESSDMPSTDCDGHSSNKKPPENTKKCQSQLVVSGAEVPSVSSVTDPTKPNALGQTLAPQYHFASDSESVLP